MNFLQDLRAIAETALDHYGLTHSSTEDMTTILHKWTNVQLKLINPTPRKLFVSNKLRTSTLEPTIKSLINLIANKFVNGINVNAHLSTRIFKEDYTDYLFSDWGIYHLHLNVAPDPDNPKFVKRSNKLLFLMLKGQNVYFIDVRDHNENYVFAQKDVLQIVHNNWPEIIARYKLKGISLAHGSEINDPEEIQKLRKAGVTIAQTIGDVVYAPPGGGITTASTSAKVVEEVDRLLLITTNAEILARNNEQTFLQKVKELHPHQDILDLRLTISDKGLCIIDTISMTVVVCIQ